MPRKTKTEKQEALLAEIKNRLNDCEGMDGDNRERMSEDLQFCYVPGGQWEPITLTRRAGRPNYSYNRTVQSVNQVVGDQRQARITGKVRAINKDASKDTAEIFGGIIRNIEAISGAQYIYSDQFKYAVAGGYGAWRISPEYCGDETFDQDLYIRPIANPFTVYWDHTATCPCKSDAAWAIVAERIEHDTFKAMYPSASDSSIQVLRDSRGWFTDKEVRIAEYFKRECDDVKIAQLSDGRVIEFDSSVRKIQEELEAMAQGGLPVPTITRVRPSKRWFVTWWKVNGAEVLEGPIEYDWKRIPIVRVPGRYVNIEGKQYVQSLIRHTKDAQRTYNYNRSTMVEAVALTPKSPYIVTGKMIKGYEDQWNTANSTNRPYLMYDVDPLAPNARPQREPGPEIPAALIQLAAADAEDIKQTTGQVNPSVTTDQGAADESGVALQTRLMGGASNAYEFTDNLQRAVQITHEMLIDMIPTVIDTERVVRIVGLDDVEDYVTVNQLDPNDPTQVMNNLKKGAYDVTVTIGPAYATARQQNIDVLMTASERLPIISELGSDIIVKNLDIDDSTELTKRIRQRYIANGIVQPSPEEAEEMPPPPPPDPAQTALVNRLNAQSEKDSAEARKTQAEMQLLPLDAEERIADLVLKRLESLKTASEIANTGSSSVVNAERAKATDANPRT